MSAPRWLRWLMVLVPKRHRDVVMDDLLEEYEGHAGSRSSREAGFWLWREAARAVLWSNFHRVWDGVRTLGRTLHRRGGLLRSLLGKGQRASGSSGAMASDVRHALRRLRRDPVFSLVAIGSLALGIGANTAMFSVVEALLITPLPYPRSDRLVRVGHAAIDGSFGITAHTSSNYVVWKETSTSFESMAAYGFVSRSLTAYGGNAELLQGVTSIGSIFDVLDVPALRGRTFHEADDGSGPEDYVVVSYALWQGVFGGRDAIGRTLFLGGKPYRVIGVMPPGFSFPQPGIQFWITSELESEELATSLDWNYRTVARLAPGRTVEQAAEEMSVIAARLRDAFPEANRNITVHVVPLREILVRNARPLLLVLSGTVGVILLIGCLNLANLLLSRGADRRQELALRRAIGAAPGRLLRLLFTESLVVAFLGGLAGLAVGWVCVQGIVRWRPWSLPRVEEIGLHPTAVGVALLMAVASAVLFGGLPAVFLTKSSIGTRLRANSRNITRSNLSGRLVTVQVALSAILLTGAGLLTRSFLELTRVDPGFDTDGRMMFGLFLPDDYPVEGRVPFFRELDERLRALRGVRSVGITTSVPIFSLGSSTRVQALDSPVSDDRRPDGVAYRVISPEYFRAMGIRLRSGRMLSREDGQEGTPSVVVSEAMAKSFWPGESALGKRIRVGLSPSPGRSGQQWLPVTTVVGVVEDVHLLGLSGQTPPAVYLVHELIPYRGRFQVVLHTEGDLQALAGSIREVVRGMDPTLPVFAMNTLDEVVSASVASPRTSMVLVGILGGVGLLTAMIGVYGLLSLRVSRQQREIGIRMALGADAASVRGRVMLGGLGELVSGLALGVAGSMYLTRFLEALLFQVSPTDATTFLGISFLLVASGALATYLPARRATRVDPVVVLGGE